jgi:hypothetical protein
MFKTSMRMICQAKLSKTIFYILKIKTVRINFKLNFFKKNLVLFENTLILRKNKNFQYV